MSDRVLSYNGYLGSVEVSLEDDCLFGKLLHVRDLVTYEGQSPAELKTAFERAVDNYLDECKRLGVEPDKTFSGTFNVRIEPELHRKVCVAALHHGCTLNEYVCQALETAASESRTVINQTHVHTHILEFEIQGQQESFESAIAPSWQRVSGKSTKSPH